MTLLVPDDAVTAAKGHKNCNQPNNYTGRSWLCSVSLSFCFCVLSVFVFLFLFCLCLIAFTQNWLENAGDRGVCGYCGEMNIITWI